MDIYRFPAEACSQPPQKCHVASTPWRKELACRVYGLQCRAQAVLPTKPQPACLRLPGLWLDEHGGLLDQQQRLWGRSVPPGFLQGTICKGMGGPKPSACRSWQASDWGSQGRAERGVSGGWARQKPRRQGAGLGLAWTRPHTATSRSRLSLPPTSAVTLPSLLTVAAGG